MANLVFNIAKGRAGAYAQNVENNSPAGAVIRVYALVVTGDQDAALRDADTMAAVIALANVAEATNTGYTTKTIAAANLTLTVDDTTNDNLTVAFDADITWTAVGAGDNWTDLVFAYDPDGSDTDANNIPLTLQDFSVTPNGGDITAQAGTFYTAS